VGVSHLLRISCGRRPLHYAASNRRAVTNYTLDAARINSLLDARVVDSVFISVVPSGILSRSRTVDAGTVASSGDAAVDVRPVRVHGRSGVSRGCRLRRGVSRSGSRCRVKTRLSVLVVTVSGVAAVAVRGPHAGLFSGVAIAHVGGLDVCRQGVGILGHAGGALLAAEAEEAAAGLAAVTRRVAISWSRAEALFLAAVADEGELDEGGDEEEDARRR